MRRKHLVGLIAAIAFAVPLLAADPTEILPPRPEPIDIPEAERKTKLSPTSVEQIDRHLKYWSAVIRIGEPAQVIRGRAAIAGVYRLYDEFAYRYTVARRAAVILPSLLDLKDGFRRVNGALAIAKIPEPSIEPALAKMVTNPNPDVRFLGWRGYRSIRYSLLAQPREAAKLFDAVTKATKTESASPALAGAIRVLNLREDPPQSVKAGDWLKMKRQGVTILKGAWGGWCKRVIAGDAGMSEACRQGVRVLKGALSVDGNNPAVRAGALQMILDVAHCASIAYDHALVRLEKAKGVAKEKPLTQVNLNAMLLQDCEDALAAMTGLEPPEDSISEALTDPKVKGRGAAVRLAARAWIRQVIKQNNRIVWPAFKAPPRPKPAEDPTTRPADNASTG